MQYIKTNWYSSQGLCNKLFPLSRALIYQHLYGGKIIYPKLVQFRTGPFRKGGIDYGKSLRKILLFDNFDLSDKKFVSKILSIYLSIYHKDTLILQNDLCDNRIDNDNCFVEFDYRHTEKFTDLYKYREIIKSELLAMCKQKWQFFINDIQPYSIGLNIRLGNDFKTIVSKDDFKNVPFVKTPIDWFIQTLLQIRKYAGYDVEAKIVTDGTAKQLSKILSLPNVTLLETPCAMTDLFALSKCQILLGTGNSSFCAWASFLGKIPTLTISERGLERFQLTADKSHWVKTYSPDYPEIDKLDYIVKYLDNKTTR